MTPPPGIDALWHVAAPAAAANSVSHLVLPDGCMDLILRLRTERGRLRQSPVLLVAGPSTASHTAPLEPGDAYWGVRFAPGWGGSRLSLDPSALRNQVVAAQDLGPHWRDLAAGIAAANGATALARFRLLVGHTLEGAAPPDRAAIAIGRLRRTAGRIDLHHLAALSGISPRTLRREVTAAAGIGPKGLARVFRFRAALQSCGADLAATAAAAGYADQAHMTREFRALGGITPSGRNLQDTRHPDGLNPGAIVGDCT